MPRRLWELQLRYALLFSAKLKVIDCKYCHILSPENVWTWLHAKGLVVMAETDRTDLDCVTPRPKHRSPRVARMRPTQHKVAEVQSHTVEAATLHSSNPFTALRSEPILDSGSDTGATGSSVTSGTSDPKFTPIYTTLDQ
ncbi:hypothetical protein NDU88_007205 [Pleurodeles waltl]|uniref:Uncharacterized protein n=1 Tax=Pleurodeles waltl TaxID=8319 RepID=A0AAV7LRV1_PLEWA|nr:hypothetical protein NDU88_007205 [Pleurodeles waltl]